jgi:hypothetical protein
MAETLKLPDTVYSPDQLQYCSQELHELSERILAEKRGAKARSDLTLAQSTLDLIATLPASKHSEPTALDNLADRLGELLQKAPVVHVTLPAPAGRAMRQEFVSWFRQHCAADALLVFQVNPDIAGGMVVRTTNEVHDFSFRHLLMANPQHFVEVLENVR